MNLISIAFITPLPSLSNFKNALSTKAYLLAFNVPLFINKKNL